MCERKYKKREVSKKMVNVKTLKNIKRQEGRNNLILKRFTEEERKKEWTKKTLRNKKSVFESYNNCQCFVECENKIKKKVEMLLHDGDTF